MRYFREVALPEQMSISEAVDWIAFGLLPEAHWELDDNNEPIEARMQVESILQRFGHPFGSNMDTLDAGYFSEFLPEVDAERYFSAFEVCLGETPEQLTESINRWGGFENIASRETSPEHENLSEIYGDKVNDLRAELDAAIRLREIRIPLARRESSARAKLLLKMISGEIPAQGVRLPLLDSDTDNFQPDDWPTSFNVIRPENWRFEGVNWDDSNLVSWSDRYLGVVVSTIKILEHFPRPDTQPLGMSGTLVGRVFLVESDSPYFEGPSVAQPEKGRRHQTEKILDAAIYSHLNSLVKSNNFPPKIEAQIAEISDFVRQRLAHTLTRTTAQRILNVWKKRHAQNDAQK